MKRISLLLLVALVTFGLSAQEVQNVSHGQVYLKDKASSHWYMGIGGGTNIYLNKGENDASGSFGDRLGWMGQLEVGRWNSPVWGTRLVLEGGQIEHLANVPRVGPNGDNHNWLGGHIDMMWNMTNALGGYKADRVWNFIPYFGVGYMYGMVDWKKPNPGAVFKGQNQDFTYNVGLLNNFQINPNFAIFLDLGLRMVEDNFDFQRSGSYEWDAMFTANAGVKFGLGGKQVFTPAELMDYNVINDLNDKINKLRAENDVLRLRPEGCPDCPEVAPVVAESVYVPNVVFFRIDSYRIDRGQQVSVHNTAEYMKANPDATVKIVAYADKKTGTPSYNLALSEKRAKAVANSLSNDYGIDSSRISVDWKGDTEQPYAENDWNRVAIFFAE